MPPPPLSPARQATDPATARLAHALVAAWVVLALGGLVGVALQAPWALLCRAP